MPRKNQSPINKMPLIAIIRLVLIILFFLIALLAIFKAPEYYLWYLSIGVTEFPWVFISLVLILLGTGFWVDKYQLTGTIIGVFALILYFSTIVKAYRVSDTLQQNFTTAFGDDSTSTRQPFTLSKMFSTGTKRVNYFTLAYVSYPGVALTLDFYPAKTTGKRPCIIVIHGGSWSSGDSKQLPELNSYLANKGYNVAAINYRMAPTYQNPVPVEDVQAALKYLRRHANELKTDTDNFILLGRSAGAQIALLAAYTLHDKGIKGVVDFYGPADMVWGYSVPTNPLIMDSRQVMSNYLGGPYEQVPQHYVNSSPIEFVNKQSVPTLIIHGENDVLVAYEHSRRLDMKLQKNGIKHFWLKLPWATHGFDFNLNGPGGQLSTYSVERFLNAVTNKPLHNPE
jgi:acetyl esterase/lipase